MVFVMRTAAFLLSTAMLCGQLAYGYVLTGRVVKVSDGDTIWVQVLVGEKPVKVRLAGIDAPEGRQSFGEQSRRGLAEIVAS